MSAEQDVCQAIQNRNVVVVSSRKDPAGSTRTVEPHIVYRSSAGRLLVDAYQTGGYSSRGGLPAWRPLSVSDISRVESLAETFQARRAEGYNPSNRDRYRLVVCQV